MDLLIGKAVKYASSKTSVTTETATSPEMLANGAVGIYYKASTGLTTLVTAALASSDIVTGADTTADKVEYIFAVGNDTSCYLLGGLAPKNVKRYFEQEGALAAKQIGFIGFDGSDSSKDLQIVGGSGTNGAIANYDESSVGFEVRVTEKSPVEDKNTSSAILMAGDNKVVVASKLQGGINTDGKFISSIVTSGALVALATSTVTLTKGSKVVTFGSNQTLAAGDLLLVTVNETSNIAATATAPNGTTTGCNYQGYRIAVGTATTSITLDQPFAGETVTLAAITSLRSVTAANAAAGAIGLKIVSSGVSPYTTYTQFTLATRGVIAGTVPTLASGFTTGSGTYKEMQELERKSYADKGIYSLNDMHVPRPVSELSSTGLYDKYIIDYQRTSSLDASNDFEAITANNTLIVAFPDGASSTGDNQYVFDGIMAVILGTNSSPIAQAVFTADAGGSDNGATLGS